MSGECLNCDSKKVLKIFLVFSNIRNFEVLAKTLNFLLALEQIFKTCLSNFNSLQIVISKGETFTDLPCFICSKLGPYLSMFLT